VKAKLISTKGKLVRKEFPIDPQKGLAISLDKERIEIRFDPDADTYLFASLGIPVSVNGTKIEKKDLEDGDRISVGPHEFTFVLSRKEGAAPSGGAETAKEKPEPEKKEVSEGSDTEQLSKIEFCVRCGVPITEDDFSATGARRIDGKVFCGGCVGDVLKPGSGKKRKKGSGKETSELTSEEIGKAREAPSAQRNTRRRAPGRRRARRKTPSVRKPAYQRAHRAPSVSEEKKDTTDPLKPVKVQKPSPQKVTRKKTTGRRASVSSVSEEKKDNTDALKPIEAQKPPSQKVKRKKPSERKVSVPAEEVLETQPEPKEKKPGILQKSISGLGRLLKKMFSALGRFLKNVFSALGRFLKKVMRAVLKASGSLIMAASVLGLRFLVNAAHRVSCGIKIMRIKRKIRYHEREIGRWAHENSANTLAVSDGLLDILARIRKCRNNETCGDKEMKALYAEAGELLYDTCFSDQEERSGLAQGLKRIEECELQIQELKKKPEPEKDKDSEEKAEKEPEKDKDSEEEADEEPEKDKDSKKKSKEKAKKGKHSEEQPDEEDEGSTGKKGKKPSAKDSSDSE